MARTPFERNEFRPYEFPPRNAGTIYQESRAITIVNGPRLGGATWLPAWACDVKICSPRSEPCGFSRWYGSFPPYVFQLAATPNLPPCAVVCLDLAEVRGVPARSLLASRVSRLCQPIAGEGSRMMARQPNEDLFANTTMTFGEHLEELRVALFRR